MISGEVHAIDEMPEEGEVKSYMVCGEKVPAVFQKMGLHIQKNHIKKKILKMKWELTTVEDAAI